MSEFLPSDLLSSDLYSLYLSQPVIQRRPTESEATSKTSHRKCGCECPEDCQCACTCIVHCACRPGCDGTCYTRPGRNLVVSIDGTSNQFGPYNTNVVELHNHIVKDDIARPQLTFYVSGIGTYAPPTYRSLGYWKQAIANKLDLAFAWNFEQQVQDAYRWLADQYQPGDRIFLFGFSRGAYQVRTLAGMIEMMGLTYPGNHRLIPFAYELYTRRLKGKATEDAEDLCVRFKRTFSRVNAALHDGQKNRIEPPPDGVRVHFVGAWDTVASVGIFSGQPLPLTTSAGHLCHFRHALALDERRVKFMPEYINHDDVMPGPTSSDPQITDTAGPVSDGLTESSTGRPSWLLDAARIESTSFQTILRSERDQIVQSPGGPKDLEEGKTVEDGISRERVTTQPSAKHRQRPDIKEVWFAGTHSDIGGGNRKNLDLNLAGVPLLWMENEASSAGLHLDTGGVWNLDQLEDEEPIESLTGFFWHLLEMLPLSRATYNAENPKETKQWPPHFGEGRVILPGQHVHASVAFKKGKDEDGNFKYKPKASLSLLGSDLKWTSLVGLGKVEDISWATPWKQQLEMDLFDSSAARDVGRKLQNATSDQDVMHCLKRIPFLALTGESLVAIDRSMVADEIAETGVSGLVDNQAVKILIRLLRNQNSIENKALASTCLRLMLERRHRVHSKRVRLIPFGRSDPFRKLRKLDFSVLLSTCLKESDAKQQLGLLSLLAACLERRLTSGSEIRSDVWVAILQGFPAILARTPESGQSRNSRLRNHPPEDNVTKGDLDQAVQCLGVLISTDAFVVTLTTYPAETECIFPQIKQFLSHQWEPFRLAAATAIGSLTEKGLFNEPIFKEEIEQLVPQIGHLLLDRNSDVRAAAESTLSKLADQPVFYEKIKHFLEEGLGNSTSNARSSAVVIIGRLAKQSVFHEGLQPSQVVSKIGNLFQDSNETVRHAAVATMGILANQPMFHTATQPFIPKIAALFKDGSWTIRRIGVVTIGSLDNTVAFHDIITAHIPQIGGLLEDANTGVRMATIATISKLAENSEFHDALIVIMPAMAKSVNDDDWNVRRAVAVMMGKLAVYPIFDDAIKRCVTQIGMLLADKDEDVRAATATAIEKFAERHVFNQEIKAVLPQISKLLQDPDRNVRAAAASTLDRLETEAFSDAIHDYVTHLGASLNNGSLKVRRAALATMGSLAARRVFGQAIKQIIPQIGELLKDENVRADALAMMVTLADRLEFHDTLHDIVPEMGRLAHDDDRKVRCASAVTMGKFSGYPIFHAVIKPYVTQIATLLADKDEDVRAATATAMGKFAEQRIFDDAIKAVIPQIGGLLKDPDHGVRATGSETIATLAALLEFHDTLVVIVPQIGRLLNHVNWDVRRGAVVSIGHLADNSVFSKAILSLMPRIVNLLKDSKNEVRATATITVIKLAQNADFHDAIRYYIPQIGEWLKDGTCDARTTALIIMGKLISQAVFLQAIKPFISQIGELLENNESVVRAATATTMGELAENSPFVEKIKPFVFQIAALLQDDNNNVRGAAATTMTKLSEKSLFHEEIHRHVPQMGAWIKDPIGEVRNAAAAMLGKLAQKPAFQDAIQQLVPQIGKLLHNSSWEVRCAAVVTMGTLAEQTTFHAAIIPFGPQFGKLLEDDSPGVRAAAARALGKFAEKSVSFDEVIKGLLPQLSESLEDDNRDVQCAAIKAMAGIAEKRVFHQILMPFIPQLWDFVVDQDADIRAAAATAISKLSEQHGFPEQIKALIPRIAEMVKNWYRRTKCVAVDAIATLSEHAVFQEAITPVVAQFGQLLADKDESVRAATAAAVKRSAFLSQNADIRFVTDEVAGHKCD
ncbi:hypothetical protein MVEN_00323400 [Mycena venus]|uniref:TOG domain-containing protein n=1 Tax=Mycena venus TaxID=2733690 RepID=A0A8H6YSU5_9AGAR|nr:hypothetical protein MVEN_00323400 [Mycena venus]